jgi:hypothetical protein
MHEAERNRAFQESGVQVSGEHYGFDRYESPERWMSYWHQLRAVSACVDDGASSLFEIGVGSGVFNNYLKNFDLEVTTGDIAAELGADVVCDVRTLVDDLGGRRFDVVCAFQVLEHLPWEELERALGQLVACSNRWVLISLPNRGMPVSVRLRLGRRVVAWGQKLSRRPKPWQFDGQHYWEVGALDRSREQVRARIANVATIVRESVLPENPYHILYELKVPGAS